jgi:hypothetical protein
MLIYLIDLMELNFLNVVLIHQFICNFITVTILFKLNN